MATRSRITFRANRRVEDSLLNALFDDAWPGHTPEDFQRRLSHSLAYVCAYRHGELIGFVNIAWDGDKHAFLLDPTVRRDCQHRGIGTALVEQAKTIARKAGVEWLHVDFDPELTPFYHKCGFRHTEAGLINLKRRQEP
jgi:GNAT superfamily N-acetyltransferase